MEDLKQIQDRINNKTYEKFHGPGNVTDPKIFKEVMEIHTSVIADEDRLIESLPFEEAWKRVAEPLEDLYNITQNKNITVIITNVAPILSTVVSIPHADEQLIGLENITKKYGWYFLNLNDEFSKYRWEDLTLSKVDQHLNPKGSELVADQIFKFMLLNKTLIN